MRDIVWIINPNNDRLHNFIDRMKDTASQILRDVTYQFNIPENNIVEIQDLSVRRNLFLMYKESINNIAKHSHATKAEISLSQNNDTLELCIRDDGAGFDMDSVKRGNGLASLQRRAEAVKGTIDMQSSPGNGTTITITVPIP
jgi:signal transduction histidine kinase